MAIIRLQSEVEKRKGVYYQLDSNDEPIGAGGMGQVFKGLCVDERTGATRPVAIKFMYDDLPPQALERARREASIQLRNDNLVEMLGFIETQETTISGEVKKHFHVVSELLTGVSLADVLAGKTTGRNGQEVPFAVKMLQDYRNDSERFARTIVINVLSGLMALHDAGYIHRDIDPSNIMLTEDEHIKLIDFGIAKQMKSLTTGDKGLTVAGKFMGKPEYAAPELALGDIQHQNQTTDIYAMGILLYQCIVGHTPFEGARHIVLENQLKSKLPLGAIKNKALRRIIATACDKRQELRYQSSAQMRVALETMDAGAPMPSSLPNKKYIIAAAAAAVILVMGGVLLLVKNKQNMAREQVGMAIVEQRRAEADSAVNAKIAEIDKIAAEGKNPESSDYDLKLMKAYEGYSDVIKMAAADSTMHIPLGEVKMKRQEILSALETAYQTLAGQAANPDLQGETELVAKYRNKAEAIANFLKNKAQDATQQDAVKQDSTKQDSIK